MGQKVRASALRLNLKKNWKSLWYSEGDEYKKNLHEDIKIREFLQKRLANAGLDRVEIRRSAKRIEVTVYVARPGVAIGRGGEGIEEIKGELNKEFEKDIEISIKEVNNPDLSARIIALEIAEGLEKRRSPKRLMMNAKEKVMQAGADGVKIWISGDFGVPKQSRTIKYAEGSIPLQTLRADVDYGDAPAMIRSAGLHGVKVWICRKPEKDNETEVEKKRKSKGSKK